MNVDSIFDAVSQYAASVMAAEAISRKRRQIVEAKQLRCGNCWHWMKRSCKPEKQRGYFKSISSFGCGDFELTSWQVTRIQELEAELIAAEENAE